MPSLVLGSDHAGFALKQSLFGYLETKHDLLDVGTHSLESCDYPRIASTLAQEVISRQALGILICGSGIGVSMAANRYPGIRAALCTNEYMARMSREHNDANVLCLGGRIVGEDLAKAIVDAFLSASFAGGRHQGRVDLLGKIMA